MVTKDRKVHKYVLNFRVQTKEQQCSAELPFRSVKKQWDSTVSVIYDNDFILARMDDMIINLLMSWYKVILHMSEALFFYKKMV